MKAKTPEQLAVEGEGRGKYTLYLDNQSMAYIKQRASKAGISTSKIVDEAIAAYIRAIKDKKTE